LLVLPNFVVGIEGMSLTGALKGLNKGGELFLGVFFTLENSTE